MTRMRRAWLALMVAITASCHRPEPSVETTGTASARAPSVTEPDAGHAASVVAAVDAGKATSRVCLTPHAGRFARCRKETSESEASFSACMKAHASDPKTPDRFRVAGGPWQDFSAKHWRCLDVPADGPVRVEVEALGSAGVRVAADCKSRTVDVTEANYGGAIATQCSRRDGGADEVVSAP